MAKKKIITGAEMRRKRLAMKMTQAEMALMFGVHKNTWARWERGAMAPGHVAEALLRLVLDEMEAKK